MTTTLRGASVLREPTNQEGTTDMANEASTSKKTGATAPQAAAAATTEMTAPPETQALEAFDYGEDAGAGYENQDMSDRKLPMIKVLQANSPQVVESRGKMHAGMLYNTVTNEAMEELLFVAAVTDHAFLAFVPRDDGGGYRGRYPKDSKVVAAAIARNDGRAVGKLALPQPMDPNTNKQPPTQELVETFEVYAITYKDMIVEGSKSSEMNGFAVIPFASTKIKAYRAWNTQLSMFRINGKEVPLFAHRVKLTTELETNAKGSYFVPVLSPAEGGEDLRNSLLPRTDARYTAAKKLHDDVLKGLAKAAYETMTQDPGQSAESDVPF